jgi:hypothetical protein
MSLKDPKDTSIYQREKFVTKKFNHGRITIEGFSQVINVYNGYLELESNTPSQFDPHGRLSIIIKGGSWIMEDKQRNPKNALTLRFADIPDNRDMMKRLTKYVKKQRD